MVLYDPQEFGGLEEYATTLAVGLQQQGHQTSVLSATWVPADNQYMLRLRNSGVPIIQLPKWLSYPASHWDTKERILAVVLWLLTPIIYLLGLVRYLSGKRSWKQSLTGAHGWLRGQLLSRFIGTDRRQPLTRLLLTWWQLRWRPDLLHIQGYTNSLLFVIEWAHSVGLPVIYEEHQTPDAQFDWWKDFQRSINKASMVVAVSEKSAQALSAVCGVTQPIVVRSPLLPDPITADWRKDSLIQRSDEALLITTVARLDVAKGLNYLLEAIVKVKQAHPATQFQVYGDGRLREDLLAYADQLGLDGNAIFVGAFTRRDELTNIMANTDIFVMSSILEGQPLGVVEAMAYGCPIVATSVGGIPELIEEGINGLLCEAKDPACLARKICTLIEDPALRIRLGRAARKSYEMGPFQPASVCTHFISIYQNVIQQSSLQLAA
jgi:glycosyltransferase involved in cell wall biosynthesis